MEPSFMTEVSLIKQKVLCPNTEDVKVHIKEGVKSITQEETS